MLESRSSYGWGRTGSDEKGFEWFFEADEKDPCYMQVDGRMRSGYVYPTKAQAVKAGRAWLKSASSRSGTITAVKAEAARYEY